MKTKPEWPKTIPVLISTSFPVLKSTRQIAFTPLRKNHAFGTICAVEILLPCWGVLWVSSGRAVWLMGGTKEGVCNYLML